MIDFLQIYDELNPLEYGIMKRVNILSKILKIYQMEGDFIKICNTFDRMGSITSHRYRNFQLLSSTVLSVCMSLSFRSSPCNSRTVSTFWT